MVDQLVYWAAIALLVIGAIRYRVSYVRPLAATGAEVVR